MPRPALATILLLTLLAGCATHRPAEIPVSGINGPNGGADETITYDSTGRPHFHG